jgi:2-phospho-L-lactate guanylyltransferase (CobY/MobA/RfbA family)
MMRKRACGALMMAVLGLAAGCGESDTIVINPADLPKLSEEDIRQFQSEDQRIQDEEGGAGRVFAGNKSRTKGRVVLKTSR